jgi:cell pole-organizing protein PopZ
MEEILSSIRRIIADEANDQEGEQDAGSPEGHDRDVDAPACAAEDYDPDDVLELTEIVRDEGEDGEVVDLDRAPAQPRSIEPPAEAVAKRRAPIQLDPGEREDSDPGDAVTALRLEPFAAATAAEQLADDQPAPSSPMDVQDDDMEQHQMTMQKKIGLESVVSDRAAGAATGAFAKLSQAVQRTPPELAIADDSGRTIEQYVEDMMRPMLRDWLDENLPTMVERIVQREIQKIVRRAEEA